MDALSLTLENGGGTFYVRGPHDFVPQDLLTGYVVGIARGTAASIAIPVSSELLEALMLHVSTSYVTNYVGTWLNEGVIHIDPVANIQSIDDAMNVGRALGQKAIYDLGNKEDIIL